MQVLWDYNDCGNENMAVNRRSISIDLIIYQIIAIVMSLDSVLAGGLSIKKAESYYCYPTFS